MEVSQSKRSRITAQDFYDFEKCPHRVYLNRHGDLAEKLPQSEFLNLLFENALTHEREVVKGWDYETPTGDSLEERAAMTIDLMSRGVGRSFQGVLLLASESGIPDLLEKVPGKSKFGDFYYVPVDIKAGSGYADQHTGALRDSPELNPIERVWKLTRRQCLHNRYFPVLEKVVAAVETQFENWRKTKPYAVYAQ